MLVPHNMQAKTVGVLGLGRSGIAAANALLAAGAVVLLSDDHAVPKTIPAGATVTPWADWPWQALDLMVISPGIPHLHPEPHPAAELARNANIPIVSEIEIAMRANPRARIVGITGTNGKSTTTALIGHCLKKAGVPVAVGGNIGDAACLLSDPGDNGVIVLELSSYQLETTPSLRVDIGAVLNITPDHIDRHGDMDGYIAAKARLLDAVDASGLAILGDENASMRQLADHMRGRATSCRIVSAADAPSSRNASPALAGPHNAQNSAVAACILRHLGLSDAMIDKGLASFAGLAHRMQLVASAGPIAFVNDSKATNGEAAAKSLMAFDNIFWIAGGLAKQDGLGAAAHALDYVNAAYLIGSSADSFAAELNGKCPASKHADLSTATTAAFADAWAGGRAATILLAPAAASFDQFENFTVRGDTFTRIARKLASSVGSDQGGAHA